MISASTRQFGLIASVALVAACPLPDADAATLTFKDSFAVATMTYELRDLSTSPPTLQAAGSGYTNSAAISGAGFTGASGAFRFTADAFTALTVDTNDFGWTPGSDTGVTRNNDRGWGVQNDTNGDINNGALYLTFRLADLQAQGNLAAQSDLSLPAGSYLALTGFTISDESTPGLAVEGESFQTFSAGTSFTGLTIEITDGLRIAFSNEGGASFRLRDVTLAVVPEPASLGLMGLGGLVMLARRRP